MSRGQVTTPRAIFEATLWGAPEYREAEQRCRVHEAYEERAGIIEADAAVSRATAERWARECVERVPGAVPGLGGEQVRRAEVLSIARDQGDDQ